MSNQKQTTRAGRYNDNNDELKRLVAALNANAEGFATHLLGKPTMRKSNEMRFYPKGGLSVIIGGSRQGLWKDFGADEGGDMLKLYTYVKGGDTAEAIRYAKSYIGAENLESLPQVDIEKMRAESAKKEERDQAKRLRIAKFLWGRAGDPAGTMTEAYLRDSRSVPLDRPLPPCVRHRSLSDEDCRKMGINPAPYGKAGLEVMVVGATDESGDLRAVQQIILHQGKKAPGIDEVKRTNGIMLGAAVKFGVPRDSLILAEGPETGASLHYVAPLPVWSVLGHSNFTRVNIPSYTREIIMAAEREESGAGIAKAVEAASFWTQKGKRVGISLARVGDHNDVLAKYGAEAVLEDLDNTRFAVTPMQEASSTAILVRDPAAALELWAASGAYVKCLPRGFAKATAPDLPDTIKRVVFALDATSTPQTDSFLSLLRDFKKTGHDVRIARLKDLSFSDYAEQHGEEALRGLLERATPPGQRMPTGAETLSLAKPDAGIVIVDKADSLDAARAIFPDRIALAPAEADPRKTDWSCVSGREVLVAPSHDPKAMAHCARAIVAARKAGASQVRIIEWPIIAPRGNGFARLRGKPTPGYNMNALRNDGWDAKSVKSMGSMTKKVAVLGRE